MDLTKLICVSANWLRQGKEASLITLHQSLSDCSVVDHKVNKVKVT